MQDVEVQIDDAAVQLLTPVSRRPSVPEIKVDAEESGPYRMQEFYPTPSPVSPDPGSQPNETLINRLDGASD